MALPGVGTVIGGLRIDAVIGRGGMGVVYRAHQLALDRAVALKIINSDLTSDPEFRERFRREARLAASIDHPHVVPVLHAGEENGHLFLAMRFVDGVDLATMLRDHGPVPPADAALIVAQIAEALDAAHARGLVHRDVKPANVLVTRPGGRWHAYLTDFGITKELRSGGLTQSGVVIGSLDYISPEALAGADVDRRADVYSLGCLLFQALTGQVPFPRTSTAAQMYAHMHVPPPPVGAVRPDLSGPLEPVLARALAKRPADRFDTAGDFGRAALAAVSGPAPAHPNLHPAVPRQHSPQPSHQSIPQPPYAMSPVGPGVPPGPPTPPPAGWPNPTRVGSSLPLAGSPGPVAGPRTGRRRTVWVLAAVLAAIVAVAAGVVAMNPGADTPGQVVAQLPPAGQIVGAPIRVGAGPSDLVGGEGFVWTANRDGRSVTRIDPQTGATKEIEIGGGPAQLVTGHGKVWVWNYSSSITPIDAASGVAADYIDTGIDFSTIVGSDDAVWFAAANSNQIGRIDMATGTYSRQLIDLPGRADSMATHGGRLYVVSRAERTLYAIDEATEKVVDQRPLPNDLLSVGTDDNGRVFLAGPAGMAELGPGPITPDMIHPTGTWTGILFAPDSVWVADDQLHELRRLSLDLQTPVAQPIPGVVPGPAFQFDLVDGMLWLARGADDTVIRVQPTPL